MPSTYGAVPGEYGVVVHGFTQLNKALRRIDGEGLSDFGVAYEAVARLKRIGGVVKAAAEGNAPVKSGVLRGSISVSVTMRSASVYSKTLYGGVQNVGGYPLAGHDARGPHLERAKASHFMDRAVQSTEPYVEEEVNSLLDWLVTEFEIDR